MILQNVQTKTDAHTESSPPLSKQDIPHGNVEVIVRKRSIFKALGEYGGIRVELWERTELAKKARVAIGTVQRMEGFDGPISSRTETLAKVAGALEKAGIDFLNHGEPGVKLRAKK